MKKNLCKILIVIIAILILGTKKSYGKIGRDINKEITNWISGGDIGWTDELKQEAYEEILANLKKDFEYEGESINNEMKMKTKISIEDKKQVWYTHLPFMENEYQYKIRIRDRNR